MFHGLLNTLRVNNIGNTHGIPHNLVPVERYLTQFLFVLRFYGQVNPVGPCQAQSVYLTTHLLGRLSLLSG